MQVPVEIAFRDYEPTEEVRAELAREAALLERFSDRITSCHVVVSGPRTRHRTGDLFDIRIRIAMPSRKDVVVTREQLHPAGEHAHAVAAIKDAFAAARRQVEDAVRETRGDVKQHELPSHGRIAKFIAGEDCGFIETSDGREIYFHRHAVLDGAFDRLRVGTEVRFAEEEGDKGGQASSVHVVGKHHSA